MRGDERRVTMGEVAGAGAELDRRRLGDQRGEEDEAAGDVLASVGQVLADEGVVEAEPVSEDYCCAILLQRLRRIALRRVQRHGEVAELHPRPARAAAWAAV